MLTIGHTLLSPINIVHVVNVYNDFVKRDYDLIKYFPYYLFVTMAILIGVHYVRYTPSFGNDTWRDSIWALETIRKGDYRPFSAVQREYKIPIVVILYSIQSLILNLDPLLISSLNGLVYLLVMTLLINILINIKYANSRQDNKDKYLTPITIYATSLITIWASCFIPQALSLIFVFIIIFYVYIIISKNRRFLTLEGVVFTLLIAMTIITHVGTGLVLLAYLTLMILNERSLRKFIIIGFIMYLLYVIYMVYIVMHYIFIGINDLLIIILGK